MPKPDDLGDSMARILLEHLPTGVICYDVDPEHPEKSIMTMANEAAIRAVGEPLRQYIGRPLSDVPNLPPHLPEAIAKVQRTGETIHVPDFEFHGKLVHGWFRITVFPAGEGRVGETVENITALKETEERCKEADMLKALSETSHALIANSVSIQSISDTILKHVLQVVGSEHGFVSAIDPITGDNVGWTLTKMMGAACRISTDEQRIAFPQSADGSYRGLWGHALNTGESFFTNDPMAHHLSVGIPDGHIALRNVLVVPVKIGDRVLGEIALANKPGRFIREDAEMVAQFADLYAVALQRRRTEDALREQEKAQRRTAEGRYQAFLQATPDMLHLLCREGRFIDTHPGKIPTALSPEDYVGKTLGDVFPKEFADLAMAKVLEAVDSGEVLTWEYDMEEFPGYTFEARFSSSPEDEILVVIRDITKTRKVLQRLEGMVLQRTKELRDSNESLQSFAYAASHDLREPLNKIVGFGGRLRSKYGDDLPAEGQEYLGIMEAAAQRMAHLIDDLLTFSRAGQKDADPAMDVDLNKVVQEALSDLQMRVEDTGATFDIGPLPIVRGHTMRFRQVFQNLLGNALKFHKPNQSPHISVRGTFRDGEAVIEVQDDGIGFEPQYAEDIFTAFKRLHNRFDYPGTGIGLALCRRILSQYGGTVRGEGQLGECAVFTVRIPMRHHGGRKK